MIGDQLQMQFAPTLPDDDDLVDLIKDMWRCIQVSPMTPPALKESIRTRLVTYGLDTEYEGVTK